MGSGTGTEAGSGTAGALVTYLAEAGVPRPVRVGGQVVLESQSPVVWFTFPGARHDIGRFHTPSGDLTGFYANILTPVQMRWSATEGVETWETTDLFLDVFLTPEGAVHLLDRDELLEAVRRGWIDRVTADTAEEEARRLLESAEAGEWPPSVAREWTLDRARAAASSGRSR